MNQTKLDELIDSIIRSIKRKSYKNNNQYSVLNKHTIEILSITKEVLMKKLKSLQSEQEVEIKKANVEYYKQYKDEEGWDGLCTCNYFVCSEEKYCGNCGKKIKWID